MGSDATSAIGTPPHFPMLTGRIPIYTDKTTEELQNLETMRLELERSFDIHWINVLSIRYLRDYYRGIHPAILNREKVVRPDVDNKVIVNYAYSCTRDIVGYFLGKSVRYVQRGSMPDATEEGTMDQNMGIDPVSVDKRRSIEELNHAFDVENKGQVDLEVATDMSICGVGYKGAFMENTPRNGTHLCLNRLDPETTFVVYSSGNVNVPMFAVSYWTNNVKFLSEIKTYVTVYTQTKQYDFVVDGDCVGFGPLASATGFEFVEERDVYFNGSLPIVEYQNNTYRLGDWEVAIPLMDGIDTLASDGVNDLEQFVQNVLVALGVEFDDDTKQTLNSVGVLNVPNIPPNVTPVLEYISPLSDAASGREMREYLESSLRVVVGVPDRKTRGGGGGDTGDAVYLRDGWQDIDLVAATKEASFIKAERESLNVALYILQSYGEINADLKVTDIEIKFNRNKTSNLQSKVQSLSTLWNLLDPADAVDICDITTNVEDVVKRAELYQRKRLEKQLEEQEKVSEVAAKFNEKNENVNTGSQKKDKTEDKE